MTTFVYMRLLQPATVMRWRAFSKSIYPKKVRFLKLQVVLVSMQRTSRQH